MSYRPSPAQKHSDPASCRLLISPPLGGRSTTSSPLLTDHLRPPRYPPCSSFPLHHPLGTLLPLPLLPPALHPLPPSHPPPPPTPSWQTPSVRTRHHTTPSPRHPLPSPPPPEAYKPDTRPPPAPRFAPRTSSLITLPSIAAVTTPSTAPSAAPNAAAPDTGSWNPSHTFVSGRPPSTAPTSPSSTSSPGTGIRRKPVGRSIIAGSAAPLPSPAGNRTVESKLVALDTDPLPSPHQRFTRSGSVDSPTFYEFPGKGSLLNAASALPPSPLQLPVQASPSLPGASLSWPPLAAPALNQEDKAYVLSEVWWRLCSFVLLLFAIVSRFGGFFFHLLYFGFSVSFFYYHSLTDFAVFLPLSQTLPSPIPGKLRNRRPLETVHHRPLQLLKQDHTLPRRIMSGI